MNGVNMKSLLQVSLRLSLLALLMVLGTAATAMAQTQSARLDMARLDNLGAKASETVDVNIDERMMQLAAKFLSGKDPDELKIKELVSGLKGIYVKVFEFEREGDYSQADVESIRSQLTNPAWTRLVNVKSKKEASVEVYLMTNASQMGGLVLLTWEPKELVVVNIIGPVDLEKLSQLEGHFGIPELQIHSSKPKQKN
jgi:uncharacterized protein DUF4252